MVIWCVDDSENNAMDFEVELKHEWYVGETQHDFTFIPDLEEPKVIELDPQLVLDNTRFLLWTR